MEGLDKINTLDSVKEELREMGIAPVDLDEQDINLYLDYKAEKLKLEDLQNRSALLRLGTPTPGQIQLMDFFSRKNLR